jgi:hypothetical protein
VDDALEVLFAELAGGRPEPARGAPQVPPVRQVRMRAEARPGRSCALILTEQDGSGSEMVLGPAECRELSAVLARAAR